MGLRRSKEAKPAKASKTQAQGSEWTAGRAFGQKAITAGLLVAVACGPLALVTAGIKGQARPAVAQVTGEQPLTAQQQSAGEHGAAFVAAWLSATRDDQGTLATYINPAAIGQLSATPWKYRDLAVVSVAKTDESDLMSVVVAANVEEFDMESESGLTFWPRRYFAVTVRVTDAGLSVVGLPAPVAAPAKEESAVRLAYGQTVLQTSSARQTVEAFLSAYLAGSGDVSRYVSPGSEISPITPAPYMTLTVSDVKSDVEPSDTPHTGSVVHVLATAEVTSASDQRLTTTYALTLTARDGRWETTSVDIAPLESVTTGAAPSPTPSR
ncbi:conjugal transfer protein [Microbacterium sp. DT81.1]|uniref:conjugal transfer protein n=1 Tax=Microbacterium sp. DT81.1 TaxID=3393413 RepID=UPI003CF84940